jgi:site-specific recombinase XerD/transposase
MNDPGNPQPSATPSTPATTTTPSSQARGTRPKSHPGRDNADIRAFIQAHDGPFYSFSDIPGLKSSSRALADTTRRADLLLSSSDRHIKQVLYAWLVNCKSATTRQSYLRSLTAFLSWLKSTTIESNLFNLTQHDLAAYRDDLVRIQATHRLAAIRSFYQFSLRHGLTPSNPAAGLAIPPTPSKTKSPPLSPTERRQIQSGCARLASRWPRHASAIALLNDNDLTISTLASLDTNQILDIATPDGPLRAVIVIPHSDEPDKVIPLAPPARAVLQHLLTIRTPTDPLIRQNDGSPITREWIQAALIDMARAGGLPRARIRQLRPSMLRPAAPTTRPKPEQPRPRAMPISKTLWKQVAAVLPQPHIRNSRGGRIDDRVVLAGILYLMAGEKPWHEVPTSAIGCSWSTCRQRIIAWTDAGVWPRIHHLLRDELRMTGRLPSETATTDGQPSPTNRGEAADPPDSTRGLPPPASRTSSAASGDASTS